MWRLTLTVLIFSDGGTNRSTFYTSSILMLAVHRGLPDNSVHRGLAEGKALRGSSMNKTRITIFATDLESSQ